jgi:hypothetical protein
MDGWQEVMRRDFAPATPAPFPFLFGSTVLRAGWQRGAEVYQTCSADGAKPGGPATRS